MLTFFLKPLRLLAQALTANDTPRQVAWGVTLGMMVGLLPKGNLIALTLGIMLCGLRVNLSAGLMSAALFSMVGYLLDPLAHRIGTAVLLWEPLRTTYASVYQQPLGPWIGFHNTVVMGQLILGLYFTYPMYRVGWYLGERVQPKVNRWLMGYRVIRWLRGAEIGTTWGMS